MAVYRHKRFKHWVNSSANRAVKYGYRNDIFDHLRSVDNPWGKIKLIVEGKTDFIGYSKNAAKRIMDDFLAYEEKGSVPSRFNTDIKPSLAKKPSKNNDIAIQSFYAALIGLPVERL